MMNDECRRVREEDWRIADWKKRGIGDCWKRVRGFGMGRILPIDRGQGVALGLRIWSYEPAKYETHVTMSSARPRYASAALESQSTNTLL
jgi:hypothetical protein